MKGIRYIVMMVVLMMAMFIPVQGAENTIHQIDISCVIDEKGTATINETWDMTTSSGTEGYKDIKRMVQQPVKLLGVQEEDRRFEILDTWDIKAKDKVEKCGMIVDGDNYELCFGLSGHGRHQYTMTYTIEHFVNQYQETQGINYAFISDMALKVEAVTIDVSSQKMAFIDKTCDIWGFGYKGTCRFVDEHVIMQTSKSLSGEKMQLLMRFDGNHYTEPSTYHQEEAMESVIEEAKKGANFSTLDDVMSALMIGLAILTVILLPAIYIYSRITRRIRNKLEKRIFFEDGTMFDPNNMHMFRGVPQGTNLLRSYQLLRQTKLLKSAERANLIKAYILKWIVEGHVTITPREKNHKTVYEMDFSKDLPKNTARIETSTYALVRIAAGDNNILEPKEFNKYYKKHPHELRGWYDHVVEQYGKKTLDERFIYKKNAVTKSFPKVDYEQTTLTEKGQQLLEQVYGLKLFLINQDNMKEKQAIEVHLWDHYLQYAALFGIADVVKKQMDIACPDYPIDPETLDSWLKITGAMYAAERTIPQLDFSSLFDTSGSSTSSGGGGSASYTGGGSDYSGGGGGGVR